LCTIKNGQQRRQSVVAHHGVALDASANGGFPGKLEGKADRLELAGC
jgi:hypothetical protein